MDRAKIFIFLEVIVLCILFAIVGMIVAPYYSNMVEETQYVLVESTAGALNAAIQLQAVSTEKISCQDFFNDALKDTGMQTAMSCPQGTTIIKEAAFCVLETSDVHDKCLYGYSQNLNFAIEYQPSSKRVAIVRREK